MAWTRLFKAAKHFDVSPPTMRRWLTRYSLPHLVVNRGVVLVGIVQADCTRLAG